MHDISRYRVLKAASLLALLLPVAACGTADEDGSEVAMRETGAASVPAPETIQRLLFIHHSCGGQLMAAPGERSGGDRGSGERCIYESHPNGGGLRGLLEADGYEVHELSYESSLGADTDIRHWRRKFAAHMDDLLRTDHQDRRYADDATNDIVAFKSCYPNNDFTGPGTGPGDPDSEELTVANAQAAYRALLPHFRARPDVLFVAFTAPPRAEPKQGLKDRLKGALGSGPTAADWARDFNTWLADREGGWLAGYELPNVAVFDYYDILTDGRGNWSAFPTGGGRDSHPSKQGNARAAAAFVPFINAAVAGMR
ncbi:hypothetical protein H8E07_08790 [bacterium]|nr:hypothetical protein [bacterium]